MTFEEWFNEPEGYGTRGERFLSDWAEDMSPIPWAKAIWEEARKQHTADRNKLIEALGIALIADKGSRDYKMAQVVYKEAL